MKYFSENFKTVTKNQRKTMLILWGALTASIFFYSFILYTTSKNWESSITNESVVMFKNIFPYFSLFFGIVSIALFKKTTSAQSIEAKFNQEKPKLRRPKQMSADVWQRIEELSDVEKKYFSILNHVFIRSIICWALNESIVVLGFLLASTSQDMSVFYPYLIIGLVLNLVMIPRIESLLNKVNLI